MTIHQFNPRTATPKTSLKKPQLYIPILSHANDEKVEPVTVSQQISFGFPHQNDNGYSATKISTAASYKNLNVTKNMSSDEFDSFLGELFGDPDFAAYSNKLYSKKIAARGLKKLRLDAGFSQQELAKLAGMAQYQVSITERDPENNGQHLEKIRRALSLKPAKFYAEVFFDRD